MTQVEPKKLRVTPKQKLFIKELLVDLNATRAYQKVYKSSYATANSESNRLLAKDHIKEEIGKTLTPVFENLDISKERVLREYANIAFSDIFEFLNDTTEEGLSLLSKDNIPEHNRRVVKKIKIRTTRSGSERRGTNETVTTVEFELHDKLKALDKLAEYLKLVDPDNGDLPKPEDFKFGLSYDPSKLKDV